MSLGNNNSYLSHKTLKSGYPFDQVSLSMVSREFPPENTERGIAGVWAEQAVSIPVCAAKVISLLPQRCLHFQKNKASHTVY